MSLDLQIHQVLDFECIQIAADHHAQIVGNELHRMVIVDDGRIFREYRAAVWRFDITLDRHQSFLAHLAQNLVEHGQELHVERLVQMRPLQDGRQGRHSCLD